MRGIDVDSSGAAVGGAAGGASPPNVKAANGFAGIVGCSGGGAARGAAAGAGAGAAACAGEAARALVCDAGNASASVDPSFACADNGGTGGGGDGDSTFIVGAGVDASTAGGGRWRSACASGALRASGCHDAASEDCLAARCAFKLSFHRRGSAISSCGSKPFDLA